MKNLFRSSALACVAMGLSVGLMAAPAHADTTYAPNYYGYMPASYYHDAYAPAYYGTTYNGTVYNAPTLVSYAPDYWDSRWVFSRAQGLPTRFGRLDINEQDLGTVRHYVVTFNGHPVLFANNQPTILRASRTFAMDGQDNVIFTAYQGDGVCAYKNYLLTMHSDGTADNPREIGNCSSTYEAHVAANALFISFPRANLGTDWGTWDVWRYENHDLVRL